MAKATKTTSKKNDKPELTLAELWTTTCCGHSSCVGDWFPDSSTVIGYLTPHRTEDNYLLCIAHESDDIGCGGGLDIYDTYTDEVWTGFVDNYKEDNDKQYDSAIQYLREENLSDRQINELFGRCEKEDLAGLREHIDTLVKACDKSES